MSNESVYLRVTPYNEKKGALAQRINVGGKLFEAPRWYIVRSQWREKLEGLKQASGAPMFQIVTYAEYVAIYNEELRATMMALGVGGLAMPEMLKAPPAPKQLKDEKRISDFDGMDRDVKDSPSDLYAATPPDSRAGQGSVKSVPPSESEGEVQAKEEPSDLDKMQRPELITLAKDLGIPLKVGMTNAALREKIRGASTKSEDE